MRICRTPLCSYILKYVFGCLKPAALSDVEGDESGVVAIGTEIVDTLIKPVFALVWYLIGQGHGASQHSCPVLRVLEGKENKNEF